MKVRLLTSGLLALAAGACAGQPQQTGTTAAYAQQVAAANQAEATAKQVSRSVWGVVPSAPRSGAQVGPTMISGSAVAVSKSALLTSCKSVGAAQRVGIVHNGKYAIARKVATDGKGDICVLSVDQPTLDPISGVRRLASVQPTEPVFGVVNQTNDDLLVVEVDLNLPDLLGLDLPDVNAAVNVGLLDDDALLSGTVLVDVQGNLLGLGDLGPGANGQPVAVAIEVAAITPSLLGGGPGGGLKIDADAAVDLGGLDTTLDVDVNASRNRGLSVDVDAELAGLDPSIDLDVDGGLLNSRDPLTVDVDVDALGIEQDLTVRANALTINEDDELDIVAVEVDGRGLVELDTSARVGLGEHGLSRTGMSLGETVSGVTGAVGNVAAPGSTGVGSTGRGLLGRVSDTLGGLGLGGGSGSDGHSAGGGNAGGSSGSSSSGGGQSSGGSSSGSGGSSGSGNGGSTGGSSGQSGGLGGSLGGLGGSLGGLGGSLGGLGGGLGGGGGRSGGGFGGRH